MLASSMYEAFFGLKDQPFRLTPDPNYLFMSAKHREAFAHLLYGVNEGSGFVAITGEVGAGKTTLVRALLREAEDNVTVIYIVNPVLTSTELLQTINGELGLPSSSTSRKELVELLAGFLRSNSEKGGRTVIIVDEAQNLDPVVLEQLRLLSNLETETEKLVQIVLVGQPELRVLLERHDLRQLNQRVTVRWHLDKLDRSETVEYIRHRMRVAGAENDLFEPRAIDLIHRYADGVPRLINIIGHRALLVAYGGSKGKVGPAEIAAAAKELGHGSGPVRPRRGRQLYQVAAVVALAVTVGFAAFYIVTPSGLTPAVPQAPQMIAAVASDEAGRPSQPPPAEPVAQQAAPLATLPAEVAVPSRPLVAVEPSQPREVEEALAPPAPEASAPPEALVIPDPPEQVEVLDEPEPAAVDAPKPPRLLSVAESAEQLADPSAFELAAQSLSRLLELWNVAPLGPLELSADALDLASIAESRGLRYMSAQMTLTFLAALDLPAVLELDVATRADSAYLLLQGYDPDTATMRLLDRDLYPVEAVADWWTGRAHIVWRDARDLAGNLGPGSGGPRVRTLQELLAEAGVYDGPLNGLFDALTENAVRRFQEEQHVVSDGIAGPVTQILLYNSLPSSQQPKLSAMQGKPVGSAAPVSNP